MMRFHRIRSNTTHQPYHAVANRVKVLRTPFKIRVLVHTEEKKQGNNKRDLKRTVREEYSAHDTPSHILSIDRSSRTYHRHHIFDIESQDS